MKTVIKSWVIAAIVSLYSLPSLAQGGKTETPDWVSEKGYWVVETNTKDPFTHIIRFYNNDDVMIYKETLSGVRLNTNRKKIKMKLRKVLETSALTWEQAKVPEEEKHYVAAILK